MPLSGGYDSRAILLFLIADGKLPDTFSWATRQAIGQKDSDVSFAKRCSETWNFPHRIFPVELDFENTEQAQTVLYRFLQLIEGRNFHIGHFLDGMALWKELALSGMEGILSGDVGFVRYPIHTARDVMRIKDLTVLNDVMDPALLKTFTLTRQNSSNKLPDKRRRKSGCIPRPDLLFLFSSYNTRSFKRY